MADRIYEITIDKFFGGMGDTRTMMKPYEYLYGEQVDGYRNPEYLQLTRALRGGFSTSDNLMYCACEGRNTGITTYTFFFGAEGEIYANNGTNVGSLSGTNKPIYNAARFDDKILMFYVETVGQLRIAEIALADADNVSWAGDITENAYTASGFPAANIPNRNNYCPYVIVDRYLWFACGNLIGRIEKGANVVLNTGIELEDNVVGLTRIGPLFRIYLSNGKTYLWDGFSENAEAGVSFRNNIRFVSNQGKIDYVATGAFPWYGALYMTDGYDFKLLKTATNEEELGKPKYQVDIFNYGGNYVMSEYNSMLYYGCVIDTPSGDGNAIATYGKYYELFPNSSTIEYKYHDGSTVDLEFVGMIHKSSNGNSYVYFSSQDYNGDCRVSIIDASEEPITPIAYVQTGTYFSRKFDMDNKIDKKSLEEFSISINWKGQANGSVVISYALNGSSTFTTWQTINSDSTISTVRLVSLGALPGDFFDIKFRFDIGVLAPTASPRIYGYKLRGRYVNT